MKNMELPQDFQIRIREQLGREESEKFLASYQDERTYGLRYNPLKIDRDRFLSVSAQMRLELEPVPWAGEGFYYRAQDTPGRLALHEAGAYYIQEPSAMAVVELLGPEPGEMILDLCGAPGGKSTQIAGRMKGSGVLVSNEIVASRAKTLSRNIERMGVTNALVLNETPQRLAERFPLFFDRIVVDAPCSGEGMFRKDPPARGEWSLRQVEVCAARQREILSCAVSMLKPGGILVYSTCTFAPSENEENAGWLTARYPEMTLEHSTHIWPHLQKGEGHYAVRFQKAGQAVSALEQSDPYRHKGRKNRAISHCACNKKSGQSGKQTGGPDSRRLLLEFLEEVLEPDLAALCKKSLTSERLVSFADVIYLPADGTPDTAGLKTERAGLRLGCCRKNRFEPSHALAMALKPEQVKQTLELEDPDLYLRGGTISCRGLSGWTLVTVQGCSAGWGKVSGGVLKNHYPKGLRISRT